MSGTYWCVIRIEPLRCERWGTAHLSEAGLEGMPAVFILHLLALYLAILQQKPGLEREPSHRETAGKEGI